MSALHYVAAAFACVVLWLIGQLFCEIAWGVLCFVVTFPFIPVHWAIVSALAGPRRKGWLRCFTGAALALAGAGMMVIAAADESAPLPGSAAILLVTAVLALIEVERAGKQAKDFLARQAVSS